MMDASEGLQYMGAMLNVYSTRHKELEAENARLREVLSRLVTERTAGLASREAWDKARAALEGK
jgi:hypothetical protein